MEASFSFSSWDTFCKGIPDIIETTSATLSPSTIFLWPFIDFSHSFNSISRWVVAFLPKSLNLAASSYLCFSTAIFFISLYSSIDFSNFFIDSGTLTSNC